MVISKLRSSPATGTKTYKEDKIAKIRERKHRILIDLLLNGVPAVVLDPRCLVISALKYVLHIGQTIDRTNTSIVVLIVKLKS